jgi:hypothetical protein
MGFTHDSFANPSLKGKRARVLSSNNGSAVCSTERLRSHILIEALCKSGRVPLYIEGLGHEVVVADTSFDPK